jgi:glycosyltransferase involved in cell wall biosynthesis
MNILMPFWSLNNFKHSYVPSLIKKISEANNIAKIQIIYYEGEPSNELLEFADFHKLEKKSKLNISKVLHFFITKNSVFDQIKNINFDILFCLSDTWANIFCQYASQHFSVPYVIRLRGNFEEIRDATNVIFLKKIILNYLDKSSLINADHIVPNADKLVKEAIRWGIEKNKITEPVYNGVDTKLFRPIRLNHKDEFIIAYAGRLCPEKGTIRLLNLIKKMPNKKFLIAGEKKMEITFPINVDYVGFLNHKDMPLFYSKTDLVILPSYTEGFANVILEAYACGKPVLVSQDAYTDKFDIFGSVSEFEKFEDEIKSLEKKDLNKIGNKARSYVIENYSWENCANSLLEILKCN